MRLSKIEDLVEEISKEELYENKILNSSIQKDALEKEFMSQIETLSKNNKINLDSNVFQNNLYEK